MAKTLNIPTGYGQATCRFSGPPVPNGAVVTFGFQHSAVSGATPASVGASLQAALTGSGRPFSTGGLLLAAMIFQDILVKFGPLDTGPAAITGVGAASGGSGGDGYAPNCAYLVTKNTSLGGKKGKGKMFIPGLNETNVITGGQLAAGIATTMAGNWNSFQTAWEAFGYSLMLFHSYDPAKGETPVAPTHINSFSCSNLIATQRQRLRR
jgi:hypothetical protein